MRERGADRGLGRLGNISQGETVVGVLDVDLPADRVSQHLRVEAKLGTGLLAGRTPPAGRQAGACCHRAPGKGAVGVLDVVPDLPGCQHQRNCRGELRAGRSSIDDVSAPEAAQRTRAGRPVRSHLRVLRFRQDRNQQAVVVRDQPGRLPMKITQGEAEAAEVCHPLRVHRAAQPVAARAHNAKHCRNIADQPALGNPSGNLLWHFYRQPAHTATTRVFGWTAKHLAAAQAAGAAANARARQRRGQQFQDGRGRPQMSAAAP